MSYELDEESKCEVHFDLCAKPLAAIDPPTLKVAHVKYELINMIYNWQVTK